LRFPVSCRDLKLMLADRGIEVAYVHPLSLGPALCAGTGEASAAAPRLAGYARQQEWAVPLDQIFRDDGYSGASLRRPGLDRLRDRAAARSLDLVLITAPDRLTRYHVHQVLLLEELQGYGCEVRFLDRPMSKDPHDQLLLQIRGAVAGYERTLITERMRRGHQRELGAGLMLPWTATTVWLPRRS
jgi:site-specific DNA recombinase